MGFDLGRRKDKQVPYFVSENLERGGIGVNRLTDQVQASHQGSGLADSESNCRTLCLCTRAAHALLLRKTNWTS